MGISIQLITDPHLQEFEEKSEYIIVVSDVHFGAYNSISRVGNSDSQREHIIAFIKLLQNLNRDIKKLKALIILGDFVDLIVSTYESILNDSDFQLIVQYFEEFNINNVPVILALGNHEIPVNNDYNNEFIGRKEDLIRNLGHLNNIDLCQGVLLKSSNKKFKNRNIKMLYDTSEHSCKLYEDYNFLLVHGFQFQNRRVRNFAAKKIWNPLLKEQDLVIKDFVNSLWYYYLFENRSMDEIDEILDNYFEELGDTGSSWYSKKGKIRSYIIIFKCYKFFKKGKSNKRYNNRIKRFLQTFINKEFYLIYGHTHLSQENLKIEKYSISNTGTWINTDETSCIKINFI